MASDDEAPATQQDGPTRRRPLNWLAFSPFIIFAVLGAVFFAMLSDTDRDTARLPSALIGQPAPQASLPPIDDVQFAASTGGFDLSEFAGRPLVVNVWASWCAPCRQEHPLLMELAAEGAVPIAGINYKDQTGNALQFLGALGNPYSVVGVDSSGRTAIEWGVYGVPETFIVAPDGTIAWKHAGPLTREIVEDQMRPLLTRLFAS